MSKKKKRKIKHGKCVKQVGFWTPIRFLADIGNSREIYWEREKIVSQKHVSHLFRLLRRNARKY